MVTRRALSTAASGVSRWLAPCRKGRSPRGYPVRVLVIQLLLVLFYAGPGGPTRVDFRGVWWGSVKPQVRHSSRLETTSPNAGPQHPADRADPAQRQRRQGGARRWQPAAQGDGAGEHENRPALVGRRAAQVLV